MMKYSIIVKDVVSGTSTNAEAIPLYLLMKSALDKGNSVVLSLKDCTPMSSSFLNSSFGTIIDNFGWDFLKGKISITDYTPSSSALIKNYLDKSKELVS